MAVTALNLQCRLLCASVAAYGINKVGTFIPHDPYYSAVKFIKPPVALLAGDDDIDACLIGTID